MGFAIVTMVNWTIVKNRTTVFCPLSRILDLTQEDGEFDWSISWQCQILNSYFYGWIVFVLPAELLIERLPAQYVALLGMLLSTTTNFFVSMAARWDVGGLIFLQMTKGMGHAFVMPAFSVMIAQWIPTSFLVRYMTYASCGIPMGAFITVLLGGVISVSPKYGWYYLFFYPGVIGIVWCIFWLYLCCDMRFIPILASNRRLNTSSFPRSEYPVPLLRILTSKPFWGYLVGAIATYWMITFNIMVMPLYFRDVYEIGVEWNGLVSSFPNVLQAFLFLLSNTISDRLLAKKLVEKTTMRRLFTCSGLAIFATCMVIMTFVDCSQALGVLLIVMGVGATGLNLSAISVLPVDMSPNFTGIMSGIMNTIGATVGCCLPLLIAFFTDRKSKLRDWHKVFYASAFLCIICMILFMAYSSSDIQPWNTPRANTDFTFIQMVPQKHGKENTAEENSKKKSSKANSKEKSSKVNSKK